MALTALSLPYLVEWRRWKTTIPYAALRDAKNEFQRMLLDASGYVLDPKTQPERAPALLYRPPDGDFDDQPPELRGAWFDRRVATLYLRCCADGAAILWDEALRRQSERPPKSELVSLQEQIVSVWPGVCLTSCPPVFNEKFSVFLCRPAVMDYLADSIAKSVKGKFERVVLVLQATAASDVALLIAEAQQAQADEKPFSFLLEQAGLTGVDVAEQLGIHRSQLSRFLSGKPKVLGPEHQKKFYKLVAVKLKAKKSKG
jgi:hypothetical protein